MFRRIKHFFSSDSEKSERQNKPRDYVTLKENFQELCDQHQKSYEKIEYFETGYHKKNNLNEKEDKIHNNVIEQINSHLVLLKKNQDENMDVCNRKCYSNIPCKSEQKFVHTQCTVEGDLNPEATISFTNSCETRSGTTDICECSDEQLFLRELEDTCESVQMCDTTKRLLKKSKMKICELMNHVYSQNEFLKRYQCDIEYYLNKIKNEPDDVSKNEDLEIAILKTHFKAMANNAQTVMEENNILRDNFSKITQDLISKTLMYEELLEKSETLQDTIVNTQYSLDNRVAENKAVLKELDAKKQEIGNNITTIQALESKLSFVEHKLEDSETLKNICKNKNDDLVTRIGKLENDLKMEKIIYDQVSETARKLDRKISILNDVICDLKIQHILDADNITKLKKEKCAIEQKMNENISELNNMVTTLEKEVQTIKSDCCKAEEKIICKNQDIENLTEKLNQRLFDLENLEKKLQDFKTDNDKLTKKCVAKEVELMELNDEKTKLVCQIKELADENAKKTDSIISLNNSLNAKQIIDSKDNSLRQKLCSNTYQSKNKSCTSKPCNSPHETSSTDDFTSNCDYTNCFQMNRLDEMKKSLEKQEEYSQKMLFEANRRHYNTELETNKRLEDMKLQYDKELKEVYAQLATYATALLCKKKMLKNFQEREKRFQTELDNKDQVVKYLQNQSFLDKTTYNENQKHLKYLKNTLEGERTKRYEAEQHIEVLMQKLNAQFYRDIKSEDRFGKGLKTKKKRQKINRRPSIREANDNNKTGHKKSLKNLSHDAMKLKEKNWQ